MDVRVDEDVTVEYVRYLTTLAGSWVRENNQSSVLVDGMFAKEDAITVEKLGTGSELVILPGEEEAEELTECWQIEIPDDGAKTHQIRYQAPWGQTEGVEIYVQDTAGWRKAETELMGMYFLFPAEGNSVKIAASVKDQGLMDYLVYLVAGGAALLLVIALIVHKMHRKRKARKAAAEAAEEESADAS